jgi:phosphate-selective porin OprO and OprP
MNKKIKLLLIISLVIQSAFSQDTTNNKFGKGLYNVVAKDNSYSMKFSARFQSLYMSEWNINDSTGMGPGQSQFMVRRARLKFEGFAYNPKLTYKIELGLSNKDISGANAQNSNAPKIILDAVLKWNFYKNLSLWAGQTKLPGNRERVVSSASLQLVDRSLLNSNFNIDRDMGAQLRHHFKLGEKFTIKEMFSVSQGEGRNVTDINRGGYQYTSRVEILPFGEFASKGDYTGGDLKREEKPKLAIGGTYDAHNRAVKDKSNQGSYMINDVGYFETNINTIFVDAMFKYKGFSLMAEYANRKADKDSILNSDETKTGKIVKVGTGTNLQIGYLFKNNWEVAGRYTTIQMDKKITGEELETQYTLGVSKYFVGHKLKVQSDVSYLTTEKSPDSELMYRLQLELHF